MSVNIQLPLEDKILGIRFIQTVTPAYHDIPQRFGVIHIDVNLKNTFFEEGEYGLCKKHLKYPRMQPWSFFKHTERICTKCMLLAAEVPLLRRLLAATANLSEEELFKDLNKQNADFALRIGA